MWRYHHGMLRWLSWGWALAVCAACSSGGTQGDGGLEDGAAPDGALADGATPGDGGTCAIGPAPTTADRVTAWNPGITTDGQLHRPLGDDGLPARTDVCASLKPGDDIQAALDQCAEGKVVSLAAGTYTVASTITLKKGVVLRGAGSAGAPTGTTIKKTGGGTVLAIGEGRDQTCYGGTAYALASDGAKESTTVHVGANASKFTAGQLALVDETDDPVVQQGDCPYFKRTGGRSSSQRVEIVAVDAQAGTLTLGAPLHWGFRAAAPRSAQITPVTGTVRWAGIEAVRLQGGSNPGYPGQMAGGIDVSNAAWSWVKDVQTDDTIGGMHVSLTGTYRVVVRDSYVHHSADYGFGRDCYGIVLRCGAAENLVENNIARYMNKPIMMNATGGGNVIAYNYADNSWATPPEWQEVNIDCHCSFPHMELIEGNWAPHVGATNTHGNAGYLTFFRNHSSSAFAPPAVAGSNATQTGNVVCVQLSGGDVGMNVIGNVLGQDKLSTTYEVYSPSLGAIFELGDNGAGMGDVAVTSLFRTGNYDYASHSTKWDPQTTNHALPASLYTCKPRWWPASSPWPWVGPDLMPMVGTLPAKARAEKL